MDRECQPQKEWEREVAGADLLKLRVYGDRARPALIYLPGIHGDWTMIAPFRYAIGDRFCFVEMTYPRTCSWTLEDYGREIGAALTELGIERGWLLGESFGSQVLWELVRRSESRWDGLILAGGFVRYPEQWLLAGVRAMAPHVPYAWVRALMPAYVLYSRLRHARIPGALEAAREFVSRRTPEDLRAVQWRMGLIAAADLREVASATVLPIHHLYGAIDPIVPWPRVVGWLSKNASSLRGTRCIGYSDHTVLASAAADSAAQICRWIA